MKRENMITPRMPARKERGQIIVLTAFLTLMILAFLAVLFGAGMLMINRRQAQAAADAGALAGAETLCKNSPLVGAYQAEMDADAAATSYVQDKNQATIVPIGVDPHPNINISYD